MIQPTPVPGFITIIQNSTFSTPPVLLEQSLAERCARPLREEKLAPAMKLFFFELCRTFPETGLVSLRKLFKMMEEKDYPVIRQSFFKKESYISRFFGAESWSEWGDSRTALGKVVDLFAHYVNHCLKKGCEQTVDPDVLQAANKQARALLKICREKKPKK